MNTPEPSPAPQPPLSSDSTQPLESLLPREQGELSSHVTEQQESKVTTATRIAPAAHVALELELLGSIELRLKFFLTGVLFPATCILASATGVNVSTARWQSEELSTYCSLMLERSSILIMVPMFLYSMIALATCCIRPLQLHRNWVRVGLIGGVVLSGIYLLIVVFSTAIATFIFAAFVAPGLYILVFVLAKLSPRARQITIWQIMVLTSLVAVVVAVGVRFGSRYFLAGLASTTFIGILAATPTLNFVTYVRATVGALMLPQSAVQHRWLSAGLVVWTVGLLTSLKYAIDTMLVEYSKLPPNPPNCYVSAAAACGHPSVVGTERLFAPEIGESGGVESAMNDSCTAKRPFPVNMQMCRLKFLEICLQALLPQLHTHLRWVYNRVGPAAAKLCRRSVWFADASYLMLKPLEFVASCLQSLFKISDTDVRKLYGR